MFASFSSFAARVLARIAARRALRSASRAFAFSVAAADLKFFCVLRNFLIYTTNLAEFVFGVTFFFGFGGVVVFVSAFVSGALLKKHIENN